MTPEPTPSEVLSRLASIDPSSIRCVYSGRPGCACGCRGDYAYTVTGAAAEQRGYPVTPEEISDRRVAARLRNMQRIPVERIVRVYDQPSFNGGRFLAIDTETRSYVVHLLPTVTPAVTE